MADMMLWQAREVFERGPQFASDWSIEARDLLRLKAEIDALQKLLLRFECEWDDLPNRGHIYSGWGKEELAGHLSELQEMVALADIEEARKVSV